MPGACVACHGGSTYNGRFPRAATASPFLGARFLPFDTGNYLFSSKSSLSEASQSEAFFQLNQLVLATEIDPNSATSRLINGWYANGHVLDKEYVPPAWQLADAQPATAGRGPASTSEVVGSSCRTCHVVARRRSSTGTTSSLSSGARPDASSAAARADVAVNASMPNALISRDRLFERIESDAVAGGAGGEVPRLLGAAARPGLCQALTAAPAASTPYALDPSFPSGANA